MQADCAAGREIDSRSSRRHLRISEESAPANFEIRNDVAARGKRPLEGKRIYARTIGGILFLNYDERWNCFDGVFQAATEKAGTMRLRENQPIAQANIPNTVAGLAAVGAVASASPNLDFMLAFDRTGLGTGNWNTQRNRKKEKT